MSGSCQLCAVPVVVLRCPWRRLQEQPGRTSRRFLRAPRSRAAVRRRRSVHPRTSPLEDEQCAVAHARLTEDIILKHFFVAIPRLLAGAMALPGALPPTTRSWRRRRPGGGWDQTARSMQDGAAGRRHLRQRAGHQRARRRRHHRPRPVRQPGQRRSRRS